MKRRTFCQTLPFIVTLTLSAQEAQEKYSGPKPPKKDVPFLLHADKLIETEIEPAQESKTKEGQVFFVPGTTSPARTPLAEPIFLFSPDRLRADQLGLFRFEVKNGRREVLISNKRKSDEDKPAFHLSVRRLEEDLFRIEVSEMLDPGEYSLSPEGENTAFCFTVY